jgi:hypothetical protein
MAKPRCSARIASCLAAMGLLASSTVEAADLKNGACPPYTSVRADAHAEGEKVLWVGRTVNNTDIVVLVSAGGRTFTILEKVERGNPDGAACILSRGTSNRMAAAWLGRQMPAPSPVAPRSAKAI